MIVKSERVPWEYLADCSQTSLENFMLTRLNQAELIRKQIKADMLELARLLADADLARLLLEKAAELSSIATLRQGKLDFPTPESALYEQAEKRRQIAARSAG